MSDGTSTLHFLDPETFEEIGRIEVRDNDGPVIRLNELEYVQREIYASVWKYDSPVIVRKSGRKREDVQQDESPIMGE